MPYKNKEDSRRNKREYYLKNQERIKLYEQKRHGTIEYKLRDKEKKRKYKLLHPEIVKQWHKNSTRRYYQKNREKVLLMWKQYREKNKDHVRNIHRKWALNNPEYFRTERYKRVKRQQKSKGRKSCATWYIRETLKLQGLRNQNIPSDLLNLQKLNIQLFRARKESYGTTNTCR